MTEREQVFYEKLIIEEADKIRATNALKAKGIEKHILIKEKLLNWSESQEIEYSKIASTYRYDKRIRAVLFKYISYLEEFYRAVILDNYFNRVKQNFWIEDFKNELIKCNYNLNDALDRVDFRVLLIQCQRLPKSKQELCHLPRGKYVKENSMALKELRNSVMHNKFLLLYRGFEECFVDGVDNGRSASLKANILNLIQFLPKEVAIQCEKDINACKEDRNKDDETEWDLPSQITIVIEIKNPT